MKNNKKISLFFNKISKNYDETAFEQSLGTKYLSELDTKFVLENISKRMSGKKVLDIGIGTGRISKLLIERGAIVYGVDISRKMIEQAKKKLKEKPINFKIADVGRKIPYPDNKFDYVVCIRVLKYIPNWRNTIKEVSRILKKDGIFIFDISNLYSVVSFALKNSNYFVFKYNEVKRVLESEGFQIINVEAGSRFPFPLYKRVNNMFILNILKSFEWLLNKILPKTILSRNILISCKKCERL